MSQEPTLYAGTVQFNILLGAIKPQEEVTQAEIENACRNANILKAYLSTLLHLLLRNCLRLISFLGALIRRLVERARSYLVDKR